MKKTYLCSLIIIYVVLVVLNYNDIKTIIITGVILFIPVIINKFKNINNKYLIIYYVFIFLSFILCSVYHFYFRYLWYDTFIHFLAGIVSSIIAFDILKYYKINKLQILFPLGLSSLVAISWELIEFIDNIFTNTDPQWFHLTGISDTMIDMIASIVGTITFILYIKVGGSNERKSSIKGTKKRKER